MCVFVPVHISRVFLAVDEFDLIFPVIVADVDGKAVFPRALQHGQEF